MDEKLPLSCFTRVVSNFSHQPLRLHYALRSRQTTGAGVRNGFFWKWAAHPHPYPSNLVPRSLVDESEGEIWQSKKICFSWLAAAFDSCPISSLKINAVFRGKLSSNSSSNLEISAVGLNERRKEERFGSNLPFGIEQRLQHDRTVAPDRN